MSNKKNGKPSETALLIPPYDPKEGDVVARVFIETKSIAAYKMALVENPPARFADVKTIRKEDYPPQPKTMLPDPFPDLDEQTKAYLKLWPYGENVIIGKRQITKLLTFFMDIRELPLPEFINHKLQEQMEYIRSLVNLVSIEESEADWKKVLGENFVPMYPYYTCTCYRKKRNPKKSPGAKK